ncbi:MAG TPA: MBL fold metallo-hydrolase [Bryobacteraceae bacterium]|nr:MBL fold metallo-hydrolase [Bryobacteraceae bacterium]
MRLSDRCFAVTGLGYLPPWTVNAGFITGDETTLIVDTGANAAAASTIHGYASIARPSNRIIVLDTERHFDHIGGNGYFRERGLDVYGHASIQRTEGEFRAERAEFNGEIASPARRWRNESEVFYHGTRLANPNCPITEDLRMNLGGCEIEILLTPGHTPSNISVYVPSDGVLFSGDCLVNGYLPNLDAGSAADWQIWLESLDRVAGLGAKFLVPGHGPVAAGDEVARLVVGMRAVVRQSIDAGRSPTS